MQANHFTSNQFAAPHFKSVHFGLHELQDAQNHFNARHFADWHFRSDHFRVPFTIPPDPVEPPPPVPPVERIRQGKGNVVFKNNDNEEVYLAFDAALVRDEQDVIDMINLYLMWKANEPD